MTSAFHPIFDLPEGVLDFWAAGVLRCSATQAGFANAHA
jgi:hypothetical protein